MRQADIESSLVLTVAELKRYQDKTVLLNLHDGEIATAKILFVDAEYQDIIVDIVHTNRPETYKKSISACAFTIRASNVDSIQEISN